MSEDTYKKLQGDNKQLLIVPGAVHTDLYDNLEKIPFDRIEAFFLSKSQHLIRLQEFSIFAKYEDYRRISEHFEGV